MTRATRPRPLTEDELQRFGESVSDALTIVVGLLAEAAGRVPTALHLVAAFEARQQTRPDHVRDSLLIDAVKLSLVKARNTDAAHPALQSHFARYLGRQTPN